MKKVMCVVGTRPEVIKMAPVINHFKKEKGIKLCVLSTAQHREMLDGMLKLFNITPDLDLNIMQKGQTLSELTAKLPLPLKETLSQEKPDIVLTQGDTTTAFLTGLACFYRKIPLGHVEAGLRTQDLYYPFPEEMNRTLIGRLTRLHFAPTDVSKENLLREGCLPESIHVTGNTVIDSLYDIVERKLPLDPRVDPSKRLILCTVHRRDNFGDKLLQICRAFRTLADRNEDIQLLLPVHPNPNVYETINKELGNHPRITLTEPLSYENFARLMKHAYFMLSDSGGVQEEAPSVQTPVLVLRENTERPEAVAAGAAKLVGFKTDTIVCEAQTLLDDPKVYQSMIIDKSPYGDGKAAERIVDQVKKFLS